MQNDFSKPQRQSAYGILIMAAYTTLKIGRAFAFLIVLAFVKLQQQYIIYILLALLLMVLVSFVFAYLWYLKFTFFLDKDKSQFVVNSGVFSNDQVIIHLDKIQQVNIDQSILQKIIGVWGLKIDTAGSTGQEVNIRAIDETAAYNLKEHLLSRKEVKKESSLADDARAEFEQPLLKISSFTLLKVGLTSNYGQSLALMAAFSYSVIYEGRQILKALNVDKDQITNTVSGMMTLVSIAIFAVGLLIVLLAINLIRTFYQFFELQITEHKHSLLLSSGLIAKKNTLVSPAKVQITAYSQNYFQKKLDMINMRLKQAQFGQINKDLEMHGSTLKIPGCNTIERDELLKMILGEIPALAKTFIPNWRFLNLPIFFNLFLPLLIFSIACINIPELRPYIYLGAVYFLIGFVMIYLSYLRHRLSVADGFIIKKKGIWDLTTEIIKPNKIQAITTFQYPWHKGVDVGHVVLHTAGGNIHFKYGNYSEIKLLVNYWLYQVESKNEDWM